MNYKYLLCIDEKKDRNILKDYLITRGFKYNIDFKIKKDKSQTFNFWILENYKEKEKLQEEIFKFFKEIKEVLN